MIKAFFKNLLDLRKDTYSLCLIGIVLPLLFFGFLAVSSCSNMVNQLSPLACLRNHCINITIGFVAFLVAFFIDYKYYKKFNMPMFFCMIIFLIIPLFCRDIKGAHRWITLPFFSIQPSEFAKIALVILMSNYLSKYKEYINKIEGLVFPCIYLGTFCLIIFLQKDFGTICLLFIVWFSLLFINKLNTKKIMAIILTGIFLLSLVIFSDKYRIIRFKVFLYDIPFISCFIDKKDDLSDKEKKELEAKAYNSKISFAAFGSGGILGKGAGNSDLKLNHLPEKHTDYIFAIIGEEYGLLGTLFILFLFMLYIKVILSIHMKCQDEFGKNLSFGIMLIIAIQTIINMGMTTGITPAKGFPLPFISYGGSSMLLNFYMLGILMNISRNNNEKKYTYSR